MSLTPLQNICYSHQSPSFCPLNKGPPPPACDMQECDPLYKRLFVKRKNVRYKPPHSLALVMTAADVLIALHTSPVPCNNNYNVVQVVPYTLAGIKEYNVIKSTISDIDTSVRRSSSLRSGVVVRVSSFGR